MKVGLESGVRNPWGFKVFLKEALLSYRRWVRLAGSILEGE